MVYGFFIFVILDTVSSMKLLISWFLCVVFSYQLCARVRILCAIFSWFASFRVMLLFMDVGRSSILLMNLV